jgi:lipid-A-disaccharide synthase
VAEEILIVAGEASADLHASRVLDELRRLRPEVHAFGVGGPRLRAAGLEALAPAEEISVMGIAEVLPRIPRILGILRALRRAAAERRPRAALLVDLPDFNLRLAAKLKALGIPVVYYVSPTIWAWRPKRARKIAKVVDRMLCILPFEERFYEGTGVSARPYQSEVGTAIDATSKPHGATKARSSSIQPSTPFWSASGRTSAMTARSFACWILSLSDSW